MEHAEALRSTLTRSQTEYKHNENRVTKRRENEEGLAHFGSMVCCLQEGSIGGIEAYFAEPSSPPKAGIMLLQDIHGWKAKNIRLVADKYADAGMHLACNC